MRRRHSNNRKYIILKNDTKIVDGQRVYRIKAIKSFGNVHAGECGGFVSSYRNLDVMHGNAWIYDDACVMNNAFVCGNATVSGRSIISDCAMVYGNASVMNDARVCKNALVSDDAVVSGHSVIEGNVTLGARVADYAHISELALITGHSRIYGNAMIHNKSHISGYAQVYEYATTEACGIDGYAVIKGNAHLTNCKVSDIVVINGCESGGTIIMNAEFIGDAKINNGADYAVFKNFWSSYRYITFTRSNGMWKVGCFHGTDSALIKKAYSDDKKKGKAYEILVNMKNAIYDIYSTKQSRWTIFKKRIKEFIFGKETMNYGLPPHIHY